MITFRFLFLQTRVLSRASVSVSKSEDKIYIFVLLSLDGKMLERIRRVFGINVHAERVDKAIPIYITYCTVTVGEEPDIYIDIRYMCRPTLIFHKLCQYPFHTAPTSLLPRGR
jgi:hypothetical protein